MFVTTSQIIIRMLYEECKNAAKKKKTRAHFYSPCCKLLIDGKLGLGLYSPVYSKCMTTEDKTKIILLYRYATNKPLLFKIKKFPLESNMRWTINVTIIHNNLEICQPDN